MRECRSKQNLANCNCTWELCSRKGICCECLTYHWSQHELPACFFPAAVERTYDRSLRKFVSLNKDKC